MSRMGRLGRVILAIGSAYGCSEEATDVRRGGDGIRDGGGTQGTTSGGANVAGGRGNGTGGRVQAGGAMGSGGRSGTGGSKTIGAGATANGGTQGSGGNSDAGKTNRDSGFLPDAGVCKALPREVPDTSLYCIAKLCRVANGWEIVLHDPRGFYVGHLFWLLRIGDQVFPETRYVGGDLTNLAFDITDADYAGLQPGEALLTAYGAAPKLDAGRPNSRTYCGNFERP